MNKDVLDIIYKYHNQLKINDLNNELKEKSKFYRCFFCNNLELSFDNNRYCFNCDRYFCIECIKNDLIDFHYNVRECDECDESISYQSLILLNLIILLSYISCILNYLH